ncbi:MAG: RdgB/HAM1 family non-canonical purine NTP pyrophosphatase [Gammaproteobacteria bacterium]|nr:MAG: RdgB/HAM1 family non-canonical purine NTP pyrophosphatase [Gammaproteobacteria bacterium]
MNEQTVVLATGNQGKVHELQHMLADSGINVTPQSEYNVPEAVEDGLSFVENAIIKARNAARHTGLPAIADDSGIEVDALHGEPGIHSARFAGDNASDEDNWKLLLKKLEGLSDKQRKARFRCLMVYVRHADDPTPIICQGSWEGRILESPQGYNGFGYDPIFLVPNKNCSAAELSPETKNVLSHRGKALVCMTAKLKAMQTLSD